MSHLQRYYPGERSKKVCSELELSSDTKWTDHRERLCELQLQLQLQLQLLLFGASESESVCRISLPVAQTTVAVPRKRSAEMASAPLSGIVVAGELPL